MLYYITDNGVCVYITNSVYGVNKWLKGHNKHVKNVYVEHYIKAIIVEVR